MKGWFLVGIVFAVTAVQPGDTLFTMRNNDGTAIQVVCTVDATGHYHRGKDFVSMSCQEFYAYVARDQRMLPCYLMDPCTRHCYEEFSTHDNPQERP